MDPNGSPRRAAMSTLAVLVSTVSILTEVQAQPKSENGSVEKDSSAKAASSIDPTNTTAERREENILEVPMTITVFDSRELAELVLQDRTDLQSLTPGLQFGDELDQEGQGTVVRGIGTRMAYISQAEPAVGTSIDGAYTLGLYGTLPGGGFDLERIEVVRGPQGTMNGRNALAGSINYVYRKPSEEPDAIVMTEITSASQQRVNVAYGGALSENLFYRLTGAVQTGEGRQENTGSGDDYDKPDHRFFAPQLRYRNARLDMNLRWASVSDRGSPRALVPLSNVNTTSEFLATDRPPEEASVHSPLGGRSTRNPAYLYTTPNPAVDPDCPVGVPGFMCGDIRNRVALNSGGEQDNSSDSITFAARYQLTDAFEIRYTYGRNDVSMFTSRDADYTNRTSIEGDHLTASDGLVSPFEDSRYNHQYDYDESAHDVLLLSKYAGPFNFMAGLFAYENTTVSDYTRIDYARPIRFGTADEQAAAASPVFGFVPVSDCEDVLTDVIHAYDIGNLLRSEPRHYDSLFWDCAYGVKHNCPRHWQQAVEPPTLKWFCPGGSEHTETLGLLHGGEATTRAAHVSGAWEFNNRYTVFGGLRYIVDKRTQPFELNGGFALVRIGGALLGVTFPNGGYPEADTRSRVTGSIGLEYATESGGLLYGRVSTGFRGGAFNTPNPRIAEPHAGEEALVNYEVGAKGLYWDSRLQVAVGAWLNEFDGFNLNAHQPPTPGLELSEYAESPLAHYTSNIDGTRLWGIEVDSGLQLNRRWRLRGFYAWQDSALGSHRSVIRGNPDAEYRMWEFTHFVTRRPTAERYQLPTDMTGNALPMQPRHKMALISAHDRSLGNRGNLHVRATFSFTDSQYPDIGNVPVHRIPSYSRWDASAEWEPANSSWSVLLFVQNMFDEIGLVEFLPVAGIGFSNKPSLGYTTNQREIGLQLRWRPYN